jgi:hypothetical protein
MREIVLVNCTTNMTVNIDESIEIECTIEYEFFKYEDLENYQPTINLTFYIKENNSMYIPIDQMYLNRIKDLQTDDNRTFNWQRSIRYRIKSRNQEEYVCMIIPDTLQNEDLFQDNNRICRTRINIRSKALFEGNYINLPSFLSSR